MIKFLKIFPPISEEKKDKNLDFPTEMEIKIKCIMKTEVIGFMIMIKVNYFVKFLDWYWKKSSYKIKATDIASIEDIIMELNTIKFDVNF